MILGTLFYSVKRLLVVWLIGTSAIVVILGYRTISGDYAGSEESIWSWALPHFMPTASLLVGSFLFLVARKRDQNRPTDPFLFKLTLYASTGYLLTILSMVLLHGFLPGAALETFRRASFALAPLQGLVVAFVGAFTLSAEKA